MTEQDSTARPPLRSESMISIMGLDSDEPDLQDRSPRFKRLEEWRYGRGEVTGEEFRHRVHDFIASMRDVIDGAPDRFGAFRLDEVVVSAEVSAKGQISLLGSGGEVAGKAGLTFTFSRQSKEEALETKE